MDVSPGGGYIKLIESEPAPNSGGGYIKKREIFLSSFPDTVYYDSSSLASFEAIPNFGHVFDGWSGDLSGTDNPAFLLMDCNKSITANFSLNRLLVGGSVGGVVVVISVISVLVIKIRSKATAG